MHKLYHATVSSPIGLTSAESHQASLLLPRFHRSGELEAENQTHQLQASLEEHRVGMQHFSLDGPVFAIVNPFQPGAPPLFDNDSYVKYLQVNNVIVSFPSPL